MEVYEFISDPRNFPKWVGFFRSVEKEEVNLWQAETDLGKVKMQLVPKNNFGVVDHTIILADGSTISNPIRVIENEKGSELIFTLFWLPSRSEKEFHDDANLVEKDLRKIKTIMEAD